MVRDVLRPGDQVIDATCGNGYDSEFLAAEVGSQGHLWSLDIQESAVQTTRERLSAAGLDARCTVVQADHARLGEVLPATCRGAVSAVMFNLGYLPGSERDVRTRPGSTTAAIGSALELLRPGGLVSIVVYPGHEGGQEEADAVRELVSGLDPKHFGVWRYESMNGPSNIPWLVVIRKSR
jgi:predicted methyltransferase